MTQAHRQRILTALILIPLLAAAIVAGGMPLRLAVSLVAALALGEYLAMFWDLRKRRLALALVLGAGVGLMWLPASWPEMATAPLLTLAAGTVFLTRSGKDASLAAHDALVALSALLYVPVLLRPGLQLAPLDLGFILLGTMSTDTAAFYVGSHLGGPKLWPRVSPKKTWSGSLGGLAACMTVCTLYAVWAGKADPGRAACIAAVVSVTAQGGDLMESAIKRWRNIKDSGTMLPGHGGILDRIDSLLTALPVYAALTHFLPLWT
ncbi:MAG: hypothetical protein JG774_1393 [Desulfomicrobiaceae bacterium]|jgi:phosphatidate cytidylyltransferase|nr:hypothetical protein [Desulfomicrobiaceae bacterium]HCF05511.1 phosphatidate cytidylyltransferase [Desulfomicrobiaceae bacterium]